MQSVVHLTQEPEVLGSIPNQVSYFVSPSTDSRRANVSYWQKYVNEVIVNCLGGLSLPRKSLVWLTNCPDMTLAVYRGRITATTTNAINGNTIVDSQNYVQSNFNGPNTFGTMKISSRHEDRANKGC